MKFAMKMGSNTNGVILWCGLGILLGCAINVLRGQLPVFGNSTGTLFCLMTGAFIGVAYTALFEGFNVMPGSGLFTAVLVITAIYPLVTAVIEIGLMDIPEGTNLKLIIPGTILALSGGIMVSLGMPK
ncbi:MAG: hypothetical protein FJZ04_02925 [Candidatus Moranbacteria bacterium]|nr:hypothetical protein [Candidatus Moranbacteria bacterium]